jgi:hypothetical protein
MTATSTAMAIKLADEVWVAAALLHRERPEQVDFAVQQIVERATREIGGIRLRPGFYGHVVQHCVANRPPSPGRYRILFETSPGRRRLFREGDSYHPQRAGAKTSPRPEDLPAIYEHLLSWYRQWSSAARDKAAEADPLLALRGSGKRVWAKEHADDYVRRLRAGWE